jgi:hypothetical protein
VCTGLINSAEALEWVEEALQDFPMLMTLEDLVSCYGANWGFDTTTIEMATARVQHFNHLAHFTRFA